MTIYKKKKNVPFGGPLLSCIICYFAHKESRITGNTIRCTKTPQYDQQITPYECHKYSIKPV